MNRRRFVGSALAATAVAAWTSHVAPGRCGSQGRQAEAARRRRHRRHRRRRRARPSTRWTCRSRKRVARGARSQGAGRRARARSARLPRRARTRIAPRTSTASSPTRRSARCCRCAAAGARAGCCRRSTSTASAATQGGARLQRHHRAAHGHRREDRADHLPRPERHGPLGRVLGELGQARALRRRGGHTRERARQGRVPGPDREPHPDDHAGQPRAAASSAATSRC